jgi:hypothetical protein
MMRRRVAFVGTDVFEEHIASIIKLSNTDSVLLRSMFQLLVTANVVSSSLFSLWRWRLYGHPKRRFNPWDGMKWEKSARSSLATYCSGRKLLISRRIPSSVMWRRVTLIRADVSEECIASMCVPPKLRFLQKPHGVISQNTAFFTVTAVRT